MLGRVNLHGRRKMSLSQCIQTLIVMKFQSIVGIHLVRSEGDRICSPAKNAADYVVCDL